MAVRLNSKLIDAAPNVVRLPTAAPRKVAQHYNRAAHAERQRLRKEHPWRGEHKWPWRREQERRDAEIADLERTPALLIVMTLLSLASDDIKASALLIIELAAATSPESSAARHAAVLARGLCKSKSREA
jgi:hypothetical protein